jgi:hypothetical protein
MNYSYRDNGQVDNDRKDEHHCALEETRRNHQLQSFIDLDGIDEPQTSSIDHANEYVRKKYASLSVEYCCNGFLNKIPLIRCLKEYNIRKNLFGDIISGLTVAIMHIPHGKKTIINCK